MLIFHGTLIHSTREEPLTVLNDYVIGVESSKIVFVDSYQALNKLKESFHFNQSEVIHLSNSEWLMPGLVDAHVHAPQYPNSGTALDLGLLDWLQRYTFPTESHFKDLEFADQVYTQVVKKTLQCGTTTAFYNATIHTDAALKLCHITDRLGQRAMVGKVCMDQNSPTYYTETTQESLQESERFLKQVAKLNYRFVTGALVPRFAISATGPLMQQLAQLAKTYNVHIQTHMSESRGECEVVKDLYQDCSSYTDVYHRYGVLNGNCSLAHCIYVSQDEVDVLKSTKTGVVHCPNSNISLKSGLCDVRMLLDNGVDVGLGTDMSGGFHPSVMDAIRQTTQVSNILSVHPSDRPTYRVLDYKDAFRLATLGGSTVLGLDKVVGNFEVGKDFDALRINISTPDSLIETFDKDDQNDRIQKFFYLGDDRNIVEVYVGGVKVVSKIIDN